MNPLISDSYRPREFYLIRISQACSIHECDRETEEHSETMLEKTSHTIPALSQVNVSEILLGSDPKPLRVTVELKPMLKVLLIRLRSR